MATAAGLVFVAGAPDRRLRAFDSETGAKLWEGSLPAAGNAMPMTYVVGGRQYVVIAAGGREPIWPQGDYVVAFALPDGAAPASPPPQPTGRFEGQLLLGRARLPVTLLLRHEGPDLVGDLSIAQPRVTGTLRATLRGARMEVRGTYTNTDEACDGTLRGTLELANRGALLVGEIRNGGACADGGEEVGALAVRRR
jgi:hypothetical protein